MMAAPGVLIVGGGLAGQRCAEALRRRGYERPIRIACAEPEAPYDRPPLSKQLLAGSMEPDELAYRSPGWYVDNEVELLLGRRAAGLDPAGRTVTLEDGARLRYEKLLIATGGGARRLPFLENFDNVHYLRTLADARRLRAELVPGARIGIVGAGFIGLEVAATAQRAGAEVTVIEALPAPLAGILGNGVGGWFADFHREQGVGMRLGAMLESARGNGSVEQLVLASGERLDLDCVLVGVGSAPATEWLRGSGLDGAGVRTDAAGRTAVPDVFAAGDAAASFDPRIGEHARAEHWDAAAWQGAAAATAMLGGTPRTPPLPSFWSDQHGIRIHYIGHAGQADRVRIEGEAAERDFVAVFDRGTAPVAALAVGRPRSIPKLRGEIERGYFPATADKKASAA
jgi:NADPH-dependent 2,4-dienoyl-CoA reductase/sulfur reductase-like enzyme